MYAKKTKRVFRCSVNTLSIPRLTQLSGVEVHRVLKNCGVSGVELKQYFAQCSGYRNLDSYQQRGTGLYREGTELLIVTGAQTLLWRGRSQRSIESPVWKNWVFDWNRSGILHPALDTILKQARKLSAQDAKGIWNILVRLVRYWRWRQPFAPELVAGQIIATLLQDTWPWKAHTYLSGARNSGKTTFFKILSLILGPMTYVCGPGTSEAALRQAVGLRGHFVLVDEFENNRERECILALLRVANQGGEIFKGSPSGRVQRFSFSPLVWVGSIDFAPENAADTSRFLLFDLKPITSKHKQRGLPPPVALKYLNDTLYQVVFCKFRQFWRVTERLRAVPDTGLDGRMQDALAVPCAIWAVLARVNPEKLFRKVAEAWQPELQERIVEDEKALLRDILLCTIVGHPSEGPPTMRHSQRRQRSECLLYGNHLMTLENYGIKPTKDKQGNVVVAFAPEAIQRHLLKGTKWAGLNIRTFLLRIPKAKPTRLRMAGMVNARVITIPYDQVLDVEA